MAKIPLIKVSISISEDNKKFIKKYADKNDLSENEVHRMAIEHFKDSKSK